MAVRSILLTRGTERHDDVLDVCEVLAVGDYGTPTNALIVVVRKSPLYRETLEAIERKRELARQTA